MRKYLLPFVLTSFLPIMALGQSNIIDKNGFGGSYFCTSEAVAGVSFDQTLNKWAGTNFLASQRYIVQITPHSLIKDEVISGTLPAYIISVSAHGEAVSGASCVSEYDDLRKIDLGLNRISDNGDFSCMNFGGEWIMNVKNLRFLNYYIWGYVDGIDANENTPNIEIGTCTKIG